MNTLPKKLHKVLVLFLCLLFLSQNLSFAQCRPPRGALNVDLNKLTNTPLPQKTIKINQHNFNVEISQTLAENIRGLDGRKSLAPNSGMMFMFDDAKNNNAMNTLKTAMPIDMLFINPDHQISCVVKDAKPFSEQEYQCKGAMAALVINAGEADKYQLKEGMHVDGI